MESQEVKYVGVDCGKKSIEVVRINSETHSNVDNSAQRKVVLTIYYNG
ncbi:hypothetical protein LEP1GSC045_2513 [Leptospira interrogans serovar Pomona str. Kennewicki LC82-25]|nr:hypothetical protein LEP1GSC045_2513 [Leptospira interrogans serovar Pomona str. Kennewicki LC82-25]